MSTAQAELVGGPYDGLVVATGNPPQWMPDSLYMPVPAELPKLGIETDLGEPNFGIKSIRYQRANRAGSVRAGAGMNSRGVHSTEAMSMKAGGSGANS